MNKRRPDPRTINVNVNAANVDRDRLYAMELALKHSRKKTNKSELIALGIRLLEAKSPEQIGRLLQKHRSYERAEKGKMAFSSSRYTEAYLDRMVAALKPQHPQVSKARLISLGIAQLKSKSLPQIAALLEQYATAR